MGHTTKGWPIGSNWGSVWSDRHQAAFGMLYPFGGNDADGWDICLEDTDDEVFSRVPTEIKDAMLKERNRHLASMHLLAMELRKHWEENIRKEDND